MSYEGNEAGARNARRRLDFLRFYRDELKETITPDLEQRLDQIVNRTIPPADQPTRVADISECVRRLLERHLRLMKSQEEQALTEIGAGDEPDEAKGLVEDSALDTNERLRQLFAGQR